MIRNDANLDTLLTDIRSFVRERWHPLEDEIERLKEIPESIVLELRSKGYFGWSIPEKYGGLGLTAGFSSSARSKPDVFAVSLSGLAFSNQAGLFALERWQ